MLFTPDWRALTMHGPDDRSTNATHNKDPIHMKRVDIGYVRLELTKLQKFPSGRPERAKKFGESPRIPIID